MAHLRIAKRLRHDWTALFKLVADMESYPAFVPNCRHVRVFSRRTDQAGRTIVLSRMTVGVSRLEVSYANRTIADFAARRISVNSIDGPLRRLRVAWTFTPAEEETDVEFTADYEFGSRIFAALASRLFDGLFGAMVEAFARRADALFGDAPAGRAKGAGRKTAPAREGLALRA